MKNTKSRKISAILLTLIFSLNTVCSGLATSSRPVLNNQNSNLATPSIFQKSSPLEGSEAFRQSAISDMRLLGIFFHIAGYFLVDGGNSETFIKALRNMCMKASPGKVNNAKYIHREFLSFVNEQWGSLEALVENVTFEDEVVNINFERDGQEFTARVCSRATFDTLTTGSSHWGASPNFAIQIVDQSGEPHEAAIKRFRKVIRGFLWERGGSVLVSRKELFWITDLEDTLIWAREDVSSKVAEDLFKILVREPFAILTGTNFVEADKHVLPALITFAEKHGKKKALENLLIVTNNGSNIYRYSAEKNEFVLIFYVDLKKLLGPKYQDVLGVIDTCIDEKDVRGMVKDVMGSRGYDDIKGPSIDERGSQITFNTLGGDATKDDKEFFQSKGSKEIREPYRAFISAKLEDQDIPVEATVNGKNAIDLTLKGINKGFGVNVIRELVKAIHAEDEGEDFAEIFQGLFNELLRENNMPYNAAPADDGALTLVLHEGGKQAAERSGEKKPGAVVVYAGDALRFGQNDAKAVETSDVVVNVGEKIDRVPDKPYFWFENWGPKALERLFPEYLAEKYPDNPSGPTRNDPPESTQDTASDGADLDRDDPAAGPADTDPPQPTVSPLPLMGRLESNGDINYWDDEISKAAEADPKSVTVKVLMERGENRLKVIRIKLPSILLEDANRPICTRYVTASIYNEAVCEGTENLVVFMDDKSEEKQMAENIREELRTRYKYMRVYANFGDEINVYDSTDFDLNVRKEIHPRLAMTKDQGKNSWSIGVDVGGTNIKVVAMYGDEVKDDFPRKVNSREGGEALKNQVLECIEEMKSRVGNVKIEHIGITFPSAIKKLPDGTFQRVVRLTNFERFWRDEREGNEDFTDDYKALDKIVDEVRTRFGVKNVAVLNDADAFGFGEVYHRISSGISENVRGTKVVLPIGTGPGYVKIKDGIIENIPNQGGHMVIDLSDNKDTKHDAGCLVRGCYGGYVPASAFGIVAHAHGLDIQDRDKLEPEDIQRVLELLRYMADWVAVEAVKLNKITGADEIILSGGLSQGWTGKGLMKLANETIAEKYPELDARVRVLLSDYDINLGGARGAARYAVAVSESAKGESKPAWDKTFDLPETNIGKGNVERFFKENDNDDLCFFTTRELFEFMETKEYVWLKKLRDAGKVLFYDPENPDALLEAFKAEGAGTIVAFGAGTVTDHAKYVGNELGKKVVSIPSALSANGMFTEKAIFYPKSADGRKRDSRVSGPPDKVIIDVGLLRDMMEFKPDSGIDGERVNRAGSGDIVSIYPALEDWELAAQNGKEDIDDVIFDAARGILSVTEENAAEVRDNTDLGMIVLSEAMAEASLLNMRYGTSRPKDGSEHLLGDAIDERLPPEQPRLHCEVVGIASLLMGCLYCTEYDPSVYWRTRKMVEALGLPIDPESIGITKDIIVDALMNVKTRDDKYTFFDTLGPGNEMTKDRAELVYERVFGEKQNEIDEFNSAILYNVNNSVKAMFNHIKDEVIPNLDDEKTMELLELLLETKELGGRVIINSAGRIGEVVSFFESKLRVLGFRVEFLEEGTPEFLIDEEDLILTFSGSGKTHSVVNNIKNVQSLHAKRELKRRIFSITATPDAEVWERGRDYHSVMTIKGRTKEDMGKSYTTEGGQYLPLSSTFEYSVRLYLEGIIENLIRKKDGEGLKLDDVMGIQREVIGQTPAGIKNELREKLLENESFTLDFINLLLTAVEKNEGDGGGRSEPDGFRIKKKIYLLGLGQNNHDVRLFARRMQNIGFEVYVPGARDIVSKPREGDIAIFISNSGKRPQMEDKMIVAQEMGCPTVLITANPESPLAGYPGIVIPISEYTTDAHTVDIMENTEENARERRVKMTFEIASMFYLEGISVALMKRLGVEEGDLQHVPKQWELKGEHAPDSDPVIEDLIKESSMIEVTMEENNLAAYSLNYVAGYKPGVTHPDQYRGPPLDIDELLSSKERRYLARWLNTHKIDGEPVRFRVALGRSALGWRNSVSHSNIAHAGETDRAIYIGELLFKRIFQDNKADTRNLRREILDKDEFRHLNGLDHGTPEEYSERLDLVGKAIEQLPEEQHDIRGDKARNADAIIRNLIKDGRVIELMYDGDKIEVHRVKWIDTYETGRTHVRHYRDSEYINIDDLFSNNERANLKQFMHNHYIKIDRGDDEAQPIPRYVKFRIVEHEPALLWKGALDHSNIAHAGPMDGVIYMGHFLLKYIMGSDSGRSSLRRRILLDHELKILQDPTLSGRIHTGGAFEERRQFAAKAVQLLQKIDRIRKNPAHLWDRDFKSIHNKAEEMFRDTDLIDPGAVESLEEAYAKYREAGKEQAELRDSLGLGKDVIAYYSLEYALTHELPFFAGGLGALAGDHARAASDLLPQGTFVGLGAYYLLGYLTQRIDKERKQQEIGARQPQGEYKAARVKIEEFGEIVTDDKGNDIVISLPVPGGSLYAKAWKVEAGRTDLYFLTTNIEENKDPHDREYMDRTYDDDSTKRLIQEYVVGVGGERLLERLGIQSRIMHLNEGHSGFALLEKAKTLLEKKLKRMFEADNKNLDILMLDPSNIGRNYHSIPHDIQSGMRQKGFSYIFSRLSEIPFDTKWIPFDYRLESLDYVHPDIRKSYGLTLPQALEAVSGMVDFTSHTPVEDGNQVFRKTIVKKYLAPYLTSLGATFDEIAFRPIIHQHPKHPRPGDESHEVFDMTEFVLSFCHKFNAVSRKHAEVCKKMYEDSNALAREELGRERPEVFNVTNAVHRAFFMPEEMEALLVKKLQILKGRSEIKRDVTLDDLTWEDTWKLVSELTDKDLERVKRRMKENGIKELHAMSSNLTLHTARNILWEKITDEDLAEVDRDNLRTIIDNLRGMTRVIDDHTHWDSIREEAWKICYEDLKELPRKVGRAIRELQVISSNESKKPSRILPCIDGEVQAINPNALHVIFNRRMAPYKRPNFILDESLDIWRSVVRWAKANGIEVQVIFTGKAHRDDVPGKKILQNLLHIAKEDEELRGTALFVENYNLDVAKKLIKIADFALNNPVAPKEASGTSGMKFAACAGVPSITTMDGWVLESQFGVFPFKALQDTESGEDLIEVLSGKWRFKNFHHNLGDDKREELGEETNGRVLSQKVEHRHGVTVYECLDPECPGEDRDGDVYFTWEEPIGGDKPEACPFCGSPAIKNNAWHELGLLDLYTNHHGRKFQIMRETMAAGLANFTSHRMFNEYVEKVYKPTIKESRESEKAFMDMGLEGGAERDGKGTVGQGLKDFYDHFGRDGKPATVEELRPHRLKSGGGIFSPTSVKDELRGAFDSGILVRERESITSPYVYSLHPDIQELPGTLQDLLIDELAELEELDKPGVKPEDLEHVRGKVNEVMKPYFLAHGRNEYRYAYVSIQDGNIMLYVRDGTNRNAEQPEVIIPVDEDIFRTGDIEETARMIGEALGLYVWTEAGRMPSINPSVISRETFEQLWENIPEQTRDTLDKDNEFDFFMETIRESAREELVANFEDDGRIIPYIDYIVSGIVNPEKYQGEEVEYRPREREVLSVFSEKTEFETLRDQEVKEAGIISGKVHTVLDAHGSDETRKRFLKGGYQQDGYGVKEGGVIDGSFAIGGEGDQGYFVDQVTTADGSHISGKELFLKTVSDMRELFKRRNIRYLIKPGIGGQHTPFQGIAGGFQLIDAKEGRIVGEYELGKDYESMLENIVKEHNIAWDEIGVIPSSKSGSTDETMMIFSEIFYILLKKTAQNEGIDGEKFAKSVFDTMHDVNFPDGKERDPEDLFKGFNLQLVTGNVRKVAGLDFVTSMAVRRIFEKVLGNMFFETTDRVSASRLAAFIRNSGLDKELGSEGPVFGAMFDNVGGRWTADLHMMTFLAYHDGMDAEAYWNMRYEGIKRVREGEHPGVELGNEILDRDIRDIALVVPDELFWFGKSIEQNFNESLWQDGFSNLVAIKKSMWDVQKKWYTDNPKRLVINISNMDISKGHFNMVQPFTIDHSMTYTKQQLVELLGELFTTFYGMTHTVGNRLIARALIKSGYTAKEIDVNDMDNSATRIFQANLYLRQEFVELGKGLLKKKLTALQEKEAGKPGAIQAAVKEVQELAEKGTLQSNIPKFEVPENISDMKALADLIQRLVKYAEKTGRKFAPFIYLEGEKFYELRDYLIELGLEWVLQGTGDQHISYQQVLSQSQKYLPFIISFVPEEMAPGRKAIGFAKSYLNNISPGLVRDYFAEASFEALTKLRSREGGQGLFLRLADSDKKRHMVKRAFGSVYSSFEDDADRIHKINNELLPEVEDKKTLIHVIPVELIPPSMRKLEFQREIKSTQKKVGKDRLREKIEFVTKDNLLAVVDELAKDGNNIIDVAGIIPSHMVGLPKGVRGLLFDGETGDYKSFKQLEFIIAALRALHNNNAGMLIELYNMVSENPFSSTIKDILENIDDPKELYKILRFNLIPIQVEDPDRLRELNKKVLAFIQSA